MSEVFLSLGANKGNRFFNIILALTKINQIEKTKTVKFSSIYETEPYGVKDQNRFLNLVLKISTELDPFKLHYYLIDIEKAIGRETKGDLQPREIDIDILFFDDLVIETQSLIVPHRDLHNRKFVLIPLIEIEPELIHPVFKKNIKELLSQITDNLIVNRLY